MAIMTDRAVKIRTGKVIKAINALSSRDFANALVAEAAIITIVDKYFPKEHRTTLQKNELFSAAVVRLISEVIVISTTRISSVSDKVKKETIVAKKPVVAKNRLLSKSQPESRLLSKSQPKSRLLSKSRYQQGSKLLRHHQYRHQYRHHCHHQA